MTDLLTVQAAVSAVMAEMPNIGKNDKSAEGYSYRGIEAVTKHVQPLLAKHGLVIVPEATITNVVPSPAMKDGWTDVFMDVAWTITGPDGSTLRARTQGIGRDRADKGANKAQTQAFKYLLLHLLCIADGKDDADAHTYENDRQDDVVVCTRCQEAVPGARSSKEPMRAHLVEVHGWVRQDDGSVIAPKAEGGESDVGAPPPRNDEPNGTDSSMSAPPSKPALGAIRKKVA